jgi:hypothetical protein
MLSRTITNGSGASPTIELLNTLERERAQGAFGPTADRPIQSDLVVFDVLD